MDKETTKNTERADTSKRIESKTYWFMTKTQKTQLKTGKAKVFRVNKTDRE